MGVGGYQKILFKEKVWYLNGTFSGVGIFYQKTLP